ncbi:hypothetical protein [Vagococcus fluvialis]|uniref:hypothetical protein n=1 Tax=Vagococcus fluvialis TaxID=2738 RepID=UPI003B5A93D9
MKKVSTIMLTLSLLLLVGCGKKDKNETISSSEKPIETTVEEPAKQRSDVINNILLGNTKISFNNTSFDLMSEGTFNQNEIWGTFESNEQKDVYIQIDGFNSEQPIYGDIYTYEIEGIKWAEAEPVQYLNIMEEAIQFSEDGKELMYKGRTGDILFSVTMFGKKKLTEEQVLELKALAKGIKIEYVENQISTTE